MNGDALFLWRFQVGWLWHRARCRAAGRDGRVRWNRMYRLIDRWLPAPASVTHPLRRLSVNHLRQEPDAVTPLVRIC